MKEFDPKSSPEWRGAFRLLKGSRRWVNGPGQMGGMGVRWEEGRREVGS